ncbi:MAG: recombinase family protein [Spirochaetota bacterium]|nr:recombinase family protein [Spirochaetota bacterium]
MRNKRTELSFNSIEKDIRKVVGYARVSTDEQADKGHSIDAQKEQIISYCKAKKLELLDIFIDEGVSGTTKPNEREGFKQILNVIFNTKEAQALIVSKNDRVARRSSYQKDVIYSLIENGYRFISIDNDIDTKTASGKLFLSLLAEFSEYEVELIRERTKTAINHLKKTGQAYTSKIFGYAKIGSKKDGDDRSEFIKDDKEQAIIKDIIKLYDKGNSWRRVCAKLEKKHSIKFYPNTVRRIYIREKKYLMMSIK